MARVKYMGTSDVRYVPAGSDFGGRLTTPTQSDVVWDKHNNHVVNTDEVGLSPEAVQLLLTDTDFLDVSDLEVLPLSEGDKMFRGLSDTPRTGTLPPGYVEVGAIPSSQSVSSDPAAQEFASKVASPSNPVVTGGGVTNPASVPASTSAPASSASVTSTSAGSSKDS